MRVRTRTRTRMRTRERIEGGKVDSDKATAGYREEGGMGIVTLCGK